MDDAASESRRPMSFIEWARDRCQSLVNGKGGVLYFYVIVRVEEVKGGIVLGTNLFDLAKTVDLTRCPT